MFWKKKDAQIQVLHNSLIESFNHIRADTKNIFLWLAYLNQEIQKQKTHSFFLHQKLDNLESHTKHVLRREILKIFNEHSNEDQKIHLSHAQTIEKHSNLIKKQAEIIENIHPRLTQLNKRLDNIETAHKSLFNLNEQIQDIVKNNQPILEKIDYAHKRIDKLEATPVQIHQSEKKPTLKEKIIKSIKKNAKSYIKDIILSTVFKYPKISGSKLKDMIVEEQRLCSKSTLYRLLGELEHSGELTSIVQGKEKFFLTKMLKH